MASRSSRNSGPFSSPVQCDQPSLQGALKKVIAREKKRAQHEKEQKTLCAATADRHVLYERSVQSPEVDISFLRRMGLKVGGRPPKHFREDFAGTGLLSATWLSLGDDFTAEGFDLDPDPVAWGLINTFDSLGDAAARYEVHIADVRAPSRQAPDVRCAQNFSWFVFKTRAELKDYFRSVLADLPAHGVFVMDIQGGREAQELMEEETDHEDFTYVWDQDEFWPVTGEYKTRIHFRFTDGSELKNAFVYDWRLWNLAETLELLEEVGFTRVQTYWEGTSADGESGNGVFRVSRRGENCESWVTYIVAAP